MEMRWNLRKKGGVRICDNYCTNLHIMSVLPVEVYHWVGDLQSTDVRKVILHMYIAHQIDESCRKRSERIANI